MISGMYTVLDVIFLLLAFVGLGLSAWALIHAVSTATQAFSAAGKQTKRLWLIILGLATLFSLASAVGYFGIGLGQLNIFAIASVIAAGIYLADVRPAVSQYKGRGNSQGPYGPW